MSDAPDLHFDVTTAEIEAAMARKDSGGWSRMSSIGLWCSSWRKNIPLRW